MWVHLGQGLGEGGRGEPDTEMGCSVPLLNTRNSRLGVSGARLERDEGWGGRTEVGTENGIKEWMGIWENGQGRVTMNGVGAQPTRAALKVRRIGTMVPHRSSGTGSAQP